MGQESSFSLIMNLIFIFHLHLSYKDSSSVRWPWIRKYVVLRIRSCSKYPVHWVYSPNPWSKAAWPNRGTEHV